MSDGNVISRTKELDADIFIKRIINDKKILMLYNKIIQSEAKSGIDIQTDVLTLEFNLKKQFKINEKLGQEMERLSEKNQKLLLENETKNVEIATLKENIIKAKEHRSIRQEYEQIAKKINKIPTKQSTLLQIEKTRQSIQRKKLEIAQIESLIQDALELKQNLKNSVAQFSNEMQAIREAAKDVEL